MGENRKKWVFTTSSQTDFTTTNLKVFTMSKNLDSTTTRNPRDFTTTNLKDSTTTRSLNKVFTTINSRNRDFTTTTILSKKMVSTTKMVFTMMVRMLSLKRKRAKRPSLSLESQDVNNFVYAT